jgi:hypothetical protein
MNGQLTTAERIRLIEIIAACVVNERCSRRHAAMLPAYSYYAMITYRVADHYATLACQTRNLLAMDRAQMQDREAMTR